MNSLGYPSNITDKVTKWDFSFVCIFVLSSFLIVPGLSPKRCVSHIKTRLPEKVTSRKTELKAKEKFVAIVAILYG